MLENKDVPQLSPKTKEEVNSVIGGDLGSNKLLALSNGEQIANPQFEKRLERTKTIRQRRASRKKRGSKNQKKAYQRLARLDQKIDPPYIPPIRGDRGGLSMEGCTPISKIS